MDGTSSQGSEASHSQEWQENGEVTWQSATHRCAVQMPSSAISACIALTASTLICRTDEAFAFLSARSL